MLAYIYKDLDTEHKTDLLDSWALIMGPIGCPETSVRNYLYSLCNNPEERSSHLLRGGSPVLSAEKNPPQGDCDSHNHCLLRFDRPHRGAGVGGCRRSFEVKMDRMSVGDWLYFTGLYCHFLFLSPNICMNDRNRVQTWKAQWALQITFVAALFPENKSSQGKRKHSAYNNLHPHTTLTGA